MAPIFCSQCRQVHEYVLSYEKSGLLPDLLDDWCPAISAIKSGRLEFAVQISMPICSDLRADRQSGKSSGDPDANLEGHGGKREIHFGRGAAQY